VFIGRQWKSRTRKKQVFIQIRTSVLSSQNHSASVPYLCFILLPRILRNFVTHKVVKQNTSVCLFICLSVCSSVSLPPLVQYVSPCTFLSLLIYRRALWFVVHGNACKWWVTNHGRLIRHYYCKGMLKMNGLFMSPCNESQVALWLWFFTEDEWFCLWWFATRNPFESPLAVRCAHASAFDVPVCYICYTAYTRPARRYTTVSLWPRGVPFVWVYCFTTL